VVTTESERVDEWLIGGSSTQIRGVLRPSRALVADGHDEEVGI